MADVQSFAAVHYNPDKLGHDVSSLIAPPYDVLGPADKQRLLAGDARNVVAVDLPVAPPAQAGPPAAYDQAAATLNRWLSDGVMRCDDRPAVYACHQVFRHNGREHCRRMFFARVRIEPLGAGEVFAHEQTFGGPKADRLALTRATRCQVSPVLGLYPDEAHEVVEALGPLSRPPDLHGTIGEVDSRLWVVDDPAAVGRVVERMRGRAVYIADGHHRYATAAMYRDELAAREGPLPATHPANFVMMALCGMDDPGLVILPYFRVVVGAGRLDTLSLGGAVSPRYSFRFAHEVTEPSELLAMLPEAGAGAGAVGVYSGVLDGYVILIPRQPDVLADLEPDKPEAWRTLSYSAIQRFMIDEALATLMNAVPEVQYFTRADDAVAAARQTEGLAFLPQAVTMPQLRAICGTGELMPHKSTCFYPKVATGLVIDPLT